MNRKDLLLCIIGQGQKDDEFGRTSLQKLAYFVGESTQRKLGHRAYHYGPYSDTLDEDLEGLAMAGAIEEHRTLLGHNVRGPVRMHRFELTQQGWQRLHQLRSERPDEVEHVERIVRTIRETAGSLNQQLLSQAANRVRGRFHPRNEALVGIIDGVRNGNGRE